MKITPTKFKSHVFSDEHSSFECCDSVIAVLNDAQIKQWLNQFDEIASDPESKEFAEACITQVFDIDNKLLTIVSDSGGEISTAIFRDFCNENGVDCQFVIDSFDCTYTDAPEDIYTGEMDNNIELLTLLHKIFN
jgi:hypothetical protein